MVKQFIRQSPLRHPRVCLWVIALKVVRILNDIMAVDVTAAGDVKFIVENRGSVVHPPLLQVSTFDEPVGLGVVCNHPPGVSCHRGGINERLWENVVI